MTYGGMQFEAVDLHGMLDPLVTFTTREGMSAKEWGVDCVLIGDSERCRPLLRIRLGFIGQIEMGKPLLGKATPQAFLDALNTFLVSCLDIHPNGEAGADIGRQML